MSKKENKRVYLDFASQTIPSKKVLTEMKKVQALNFNPSNIYKEGVEAENLLNDARGGIANVLGVRSHEIYFTGSGTLSCATAIFGIVNKYKEENLKNKKFIIPHIVTSNIEHAAVLENIKYLESRGEIEATYLEVNEEGFINLKDIYKNIKENTILISIMYVNNEIGTVQEIKNISKEIKLWKKDKNRSIVEYPYFHTDAAQAANYFSLYIDMLGVDMLSLNGSKIYGPKSSGILFKKEYVEISSLYFGGGQERNIFSGTLDIEKAIGLSVALEDAQNNLKNKNIYQEIAEKRNYLLDKISSSIKEVKLNGYLNKDEWKVEKIGLAREVRIPKRIPSNISIWIPDFPSDEMVLRLDQRGFAISAGSACSAKEGEESHVIFNLYKNKIKKEEARKIARETVRISIDKDTQKEDLDIFVKNLKDIYLKFKNK